MKKIKVILNCDTKNEIDDQFALAYALLSPEIELLGVVSVHNKKKHGRNSVDIYHREAQKIIELAGAKVPAFKGSRRPLGAKLKPELSAGVEFILNTCLTQNEVNVVCTGPATDLANAYLLEPKIARRAHFIWLGGFSSAKEARRLRQREVNFCADRHAARVIFDSEINLSFVPAWGAADSLVIQSELLASALRQKQSPLSNYLARLIEKHRINRHIRYFIPLAWQRYWVLFDLAAIALVKNFAVEKKTMPACKIEKKKIIFPEKNRMITFASNINSHAILNQMEEYLLENH